MAFRQKEGEPWETLAGLRAYGMYPLHHKVAGVGVGGAPILASFTAT